jgi:hypothetical protein
LPKGSAEVARVTSGHFITTVRPVGSTPTIFVDSIEKARHFKHDNSQDRCEIVLCDGRHIELSFHLFTASELLTIFGPCRRGSNAAGRTIYLEFLFPAPLSSLESLCGIRDIRTGQEHFQAKQGPVRWEMRRKGCSMMSFALDFAFVAIGVAAFAVTALYLNACARL